MPLGAGADVLEDFRSAEDTSAGVTGGTSLNAGRMRGGGGEGLGGKKCCRSVLLISVGEEAFLCVGKRSGALPAAILLSLYLFFFFFFFLFLNHMIIVLRYKILHAAYAMV